LAYAERVIALERKPRGIGGSNLPNASATRDRPNDPLFFFHPFKKMAMSCAGTASFVTRVVVPPGVPWISPGGTNHPRDEIEEILSMSKTDDRAKSRKTGHDY